ncbi:MAG: arginine--tRNA ligase, partial [Candidatus Nanohaloarchaea archaeon]|nr:arginine--tRNA ligase [Candidatus Nanohaloarchaea archaeon]
MTAIRGRIRQQLAEVFPELEEIEIEIPDNPEHGEYATNAAMQAAGEAGKQPRQFAEERAEDLRTVDIDGVEAIEVAGPGFINFHVDRQRLAADIVTGVGEQEEEREKKLIVEHTSPNPNKPRHMGTMRCAILGDTMARLASFLGYDVEVQDYINDLGRSTAQTVYAYQEFRDELEEEVREKKDDFW